MNALVGGRRGVDTLIPSKQQMNAKFHLRRLELKLKELSLRSYVCKDSLYLCENPLVLGLVLIMGGDLGLRPVDHRSVLLHSSTASLHVSLILRYKVEVEYWARLLRTTVYIVLSLPSISMYTVSIWLTPRQRTAIV